MISDLCFVNYEYMFKNISLKFTQPVGLTCWTMWRLIFPEQPRQLYGTGTFRDQVKHKVTNKRTRWNCGRPVRPERL